MLVKVAIDLSLDRLFTYEVPEELEKKLAVGQLLSVPFGHRFARGFAMAISSDPPEDSAFKLKDVAEIVDQTPFFSVELLELVKQVASYTASPLESVIKAALPAAVLKKNAKARELLFVEPAIAGSGDRPPESGDRPPASGDSPHGCDILSRLNRREKWVSLPMRAMIDHISRIRLELNTPVPLSLEETVIPTNGRKIRYAQIT